MEQLTIPSTLTDVRWDSFHAIREEYRPALHASGEHASAWESLFRAAHGAQNSAETPTRDIVNGTVQMTCKTVYTDTRSSAQSNGEMDRSTGAYKIHTYTLPPDIPEEQEILYILEHPEGWVHSEYNSEFDMETE